MVWRYISPPPMTKISLPSERACLRASSTLRHTVTPSAFGIEELTTILFRLGSGRPIDSKVLRPMIIVLPEVSCLKFFRSSGMCQISLLSLPMTRSLVMAAMRVIIVFSPLFLYRDLKLDPGMALVIEQFGMFSLPLKDRGEKLGDDLR